MWEAFAAQKLLTIFQQKILTNFTFLLSYRFEALVEREWLQAGHPFGERCAKSAHAITKNRQESPVFLLFLDCVWQVVKHETYTLNVLKMQIVWQTVKALMRLLPGQFGLVPGFPRSGKNKMKFFPGQGKVREFCGWPGKFRKDWESQGKVREFENK